MGNFRLGENTINMASFKDSLKTIQSIQSDTFYGRVFIIFKVRIVQGYKGGLNYHIFTVSSLLFDVFFSTPSALSGP